jgi:NADH:ubiquinone oxidoreductase subunit 6 (subunit J)
MTPDLVLFDVAALIALGAAVQLLRCREPRAAIRWFAVAVAAVAAVELLLLAPFVAVAALFAGACLVAIFVFVSDLAGPSVAASGGRRRRTLLLGAATIGVLAWVFFGTWGRQLAFPGHDLAPGASFGGLRQLSAGVASDKLVLSVALPLLLFVGALGAVALASRAESEPSDGDRPR